MSRCGIRARWRRKTAVMSLLVGTGVLFASGALNCASFGVQQTLSTLDFCFLLDCQNGAFGGLLDPCGQGGLLIDNDQGSEQELQSLLVDCP
ncbi:MAG: hypothetical protein IH988_00275 [Planctomycetes bacterium]|nr:hypothetical protein [Planctomycetota bacterium]